MELVTLVDHREKSTLLGPLHVFRAENGTRYSTSHPWIASLCKIAVDEHKPIYLWSSAAWFDRTIQHAQWTAQREIA